MSDSSNKNKPSVLGEGNFLCIMIKINASLGLGSIAEWMWLSPWQASMPEFYDKWLNTAGGSLTAWLIYVLFAWGGLKVGSILFYGKGIMGSRKYPLRYMGYGLLLIPFAPFIDMKLSHPYFSA